MIALQKCLCNDQSHKQVWTSLNMFGVQSDLTRSKFWIDLEIHHFCCCFLTKKFSILKISRFESCFFPYSFFHSFITSKQGIWQCHRLVGQSWWKKFVKVPHGLMTNSKLSSFVSSSFDFVAQSTSQRVCSQLCWPHVSYQTGQTESSQMFLHFGQNQRTMTQSLIVCLFDLKFMH